MERMFIDDDFKDWVIGQLPLHLISSLYARYEKEHKRINLSGFVPISELIAELEAGFEGHIDLEFEKDLAKFRKYLDDNYPTAKGACE